MKRYIKPNTDIHNIEVVVMQATSPKVQNENATTTGEYYDDAKQTTFPTTSVWEEEE